MAAHGQLYAVKLSWTNADNDDLGAVEVWRSATDNRAAATKIHTESAGRRGERQSWTDDGLTAGDIWFYWTRSVNRAGIASASFYPPSALAGWSAKVEGLGTVDPTLTGHTKALTSGVAASLFEVPMPVGGMAGGKVVATVRVDDSVNRQILSQEFLWAVTRVGSQWITSIMQRRPGRASGPRHHRRRRAGPLLLRSWPVVAAGSLLANITVNPGNEVAALSAGTLSTVWDWTDQGTTATLTLVATTSLTPIVCAVDYSVTNPGQAALHYL